MTKVLPYAWPTVSVSKIKICQTQLKFYISANKFVLYCITAKRISLPLLLFTDETHKVRMHSLSSLEFRFEVDFIWKPAQTELMKHPLGRYWFIGVERIWEELMF